MSHGLEVENCGFESLHPAHDWEGKHCPGTEHLAKDYGDDIAAALAAENEGMAHHEDE